MRRRNVVSGIVVFVLWFLLFSGTSGAQAQSDTTAPAAGSPAAAPSSSETAAPEGSPEDRRELQKVEDEVEKLKEDIFRSKARTLLLEEFLINTEVKVYFRNMARKDFRLKSALYILDNSEIYKKEFAPGEEPPRRKEEMVFTGITTPGRHEISSILVYEGRESAGFTQKDYEFQVTADYSFIANRGETTVVTLIATDRGRFSKDIDRSAAQYQVDLDLKVESDRLAGRRRQIEKRTFGLGIESGMLIESFQMVSNNLNIQQQYASVIPMGLRANWWFHQNFGVEGYFQVANWEAKTGVNNQRVDMSMMWFGVDAKLRYAFSRSVTSPVVILDLGVNVLDSGADSFPSPITRLNETYKYFDVGFEGIIPFNTYVGMKGKALFFPYVILDESPVQSGRDGNTKGYQLEAMFYWNIWKGLTADIGYRFVLFDNDFTGRGNRTDQNGTVLSLVQSRTYYQGAVLALRYEF